MFHRLELKPMMGLALLALGLVLLSACGSSAEKLNEDGNAAFAKQAFDEALQAYESAKIESPELAEPYYNAANALYRQEKYAEALEELQNALAYTDDQTLAESSLYNMGNSSYNAQEWEAAVDAYREALLLNPDDQDAKHNLEVALLQQQQQQENQDQQQEQSEDSESQQDEQQQQGHNQQQEENQSQKSDQEQEQDQSQEGDDQQEQNQSGESDRQQEQDQSQDSDQQEGQNQGQNGDRSQNEDRQNTEEQRDQNQQTGQGQPQDGQQDANEGARPGQMPAPGQRMTAEQARQLLEAIAQDSDTLQERLGQFFFVPAGPPVQDW